MPLPKPSKKESDKEFISRCAADPTMNKDFPKNEQRLGVCYSLLKQSKKKKSQANWDETKADIDKSGAIIY